jgi:phage terminase large subunit
MEPEPAGLEEGEGEGPVSMTEELSGILTSIHRQANPLNAFNDVILRRGRYWKAQREICRALWDPSVNTVVVPAGHSVGKSYSAAGFILGWSTLWLDSLVMSTSPSNTQLSGVLWKEIRKARNHAPLIKNSGRLTKLPNHLDLGDGWSAYGFSTNQAERLQGFHAAGGPLLNVVDEASGIKDPDVWATLKSLKPRKQLLISNPLHAHGYFYDQCRRAESDPTVRLIRIPSTDSPDIRLEESPRGLADAGWLREMIADYGEDSQTFRVRVLAQFPDGSADQLVPSAWLDRAEKAAHKPWGPRRLSIDVSECQGGDMAVLVARDDNGIIDFRAGNRGGFGWIADQARELAVKYSVDPAHVSFDASGSGADFANRLHQVGIVGAKPYRGGRTSKSVTWDNLRSACYWALRRRLNPCHVNELGRIPEPFRIPREFMQRLRPELKEITYETVDKGQISVRDGTEVRAALRFSPDYADALAQSFMSPNS